MKNILVACSGLIFIIACNRTSHKDYPFQSVPFTDISINDNFWAPRIETNRKITIPFNFAKCEETGRINVFTTAAHKEKGKAYKDLPWGDSDIYKIMEGAAYTLATHPDPRLEKYMDSLIAVIASAQEPDGYLFPSMTLYGMKRWVEENQSSHETYMVGHLYEAAVAYFYATGKRNFLDIAIKSADLLCNTFGPGKNENIAPGHQEIELALVKLYRATGQQKYLDLAKFFIDRRGTFPIVWDTTKPWNSPRDRQSDKPITEQTEAYGHVVRANYMYTGIADVISLTGDKKYIAVLDNIWNNVVNTKIYITGGEGSQPFCEEYGKNYNLPNDTAYNETCAAIANVFWNQRMFMIHGESKYIDVLERTLYNGLLSGYSFDGIEFFYPNPLEADGKRMFNHGACSRQKWFGCSCCPPNICRFIASLSGYIYATKEDTVFVNLFIGSKGKINLNKDTLNIAQVTEYPWNGKIQINIDPVKETKASVAVRIPCWALNKPMPGTLYSYTEKADTLFNLAVNSLNTKYEWHNGYAVITRNWKKGDFIDLVLQMPIRKVMADEKVKADSGRFCLTRGPMVYCAEGVDNNGKVLNLMLSLTDTFKLDFRKDLLNGVWGISGDAYTSDKSKPVPFKAIPYYAWANRGCNEMEVWFRKK
jgi:uncharacterized protein